MSKSILFDPIAHTYSTNFWTTVGGSPSITSNKLRINTAEIASKWTFSGTGSFKVKATVPVAPTTSQDKTFGFKSPATGEGFYFNITGSVFKAFMVDADGTSSNVTITWDGDWTATATVFELVLKRDSAIVLVDGSELGEFTTNTIKGPMSLYIDNGNADNLDFDYVMVQGADDATNIVAA